MQFPTLNFRLPPWVDTLFPKDEYIYKTPEERMGLVIALSRMNVEHKTGGPFGAAVFEMNTGKLIAPGVNMVTAANCSLLHAEMAAISLAQQIKGTYDLGAEGQPACELVSSTEPCAMCMGGIIWSGIRHLVCGARDEDARAVGFDEGAKLDDWVKAFADRDISVTQDVSRQKAAEVLRHYAESGGVIYNARVQQSG